MHIRTTACIEAHANMYLQPQIFNPYLITLVYWCTLKIWYIRSSLTFHDCTTFDSVNRSVALGNKSFTIERDAGKWLAYYVHASDKLNLKRLFLNKTVLMQTDLWHHYFSDIAYVCNTFEGRKVIYGCCLDNRVLSKIRPMLNIKKVKIHNNWQAPQIGSTSAVPRAALKANGIQMGSFAGPLSP